MANHGVAKLPWSIDSKIMELFAGAAMRAAFGGFYVHEPEHGSLGYVQAGSKPAMSTQVWSDGPTHVEMRRGCDGLDAVAQEALFQSTASCFGAPTAWDDGEYAMETPGVLKLLDLRRFHDGCSAKSLGLDRPGKKDDGPAWLLTGPMRAKARKMLAPIFFDPPDIALTGIYQPGANRDAYLRAREEDALDWGSTLDWAGTVEAAYPDGEGLRARAAFAALLPSAALGRPCPASALGKVGLAGLERALAVAVYWSRAEVAKQIHERLCSVSADPKASEERSWELCCKFFEKKGKATHGMPWPDQKASAEALSESLSLSRSAAKPAPKLRAPAKRRI